MLRSIIVEYVMLTLLQSVKRLRRKELFVCLLFVGIAHSKVKLFIHEAIV